MLIHTILCSGKQIEQTFNKADDFTASKLRLSVNSVHKADGYLHYRPPCVRHTTVLTSDNIYMYVTPQYSHQAVYTCMSHHSTHIRQYIHVRHTTVLTSDSETDTYFCYRVAKASGSHHHLHLEHVAFRSTRLDQLLENTFPVQPEKRVTRYL